MNKQIIKSELRSLNLAYGQSYEDIMVVLQEIIDERNSRVKKTNIYTIDLEGDILFSGTFEECEDYIKRNRIPMKRDKKQYGLTTPTEENIVLCYSNEFSHLF